MVEFLDSFNCICFMGIQDSIHNARLKIDRQSERTSRIQFDEHTGTAKQTNSITNCGGIIFENAIAFEL